MMHLPMDDISGGLDRMAASPVVEQLRAMPVSTHGLLAGCFVGGLVLWAAGGRSLRIGFGLLGTLLGIVAGLLLPVALALPTPATLAAGVGGVLGLLVGLTTFRLTIAVAMSALAGVLAPLLTLGVLRSAAAIPEPPPVAQIHAVAEPAATGAARPDVEHLAEAGARALGDAHGREPDALAPAARRLAASTAMLRDWLVTVWHDLRPHWNALPERHRALVVLAVACGLVAGFAFGTLVPSSSAIVVTGCVGPAIWLPSGAWLATAAGAPDPRGLVEGSPLLWAGLWLILAGMGVAIQWRRPGSTADSHR